ncbi:MAG: phage tail protein [Rickettsiaceae bacterium]|nr:phage tail protein [Rickettsiaceae bacterium]
MNFWKDGNLWEKGHWVNNKFGASSVASILLEISQRCGIDINHVEVSSVDEVVEGLILSNQTTGVSAINTLRTSYFFDICANNGEIITFQKRGLKQELPLSSKFCLKISDNNFIEEIEISKETTLGAINLHYLHHHKDYDSEYIYINNEMTTYKSKAMICLPIVLTEEEASNIGKLILKNAAIEDRIIKFIINNNNINIKPTDFIILKHHEVKYSIRIINTQINSNNKTAVIGIIDKRENYFSIPASRNQLDLQTSLNIDSALIVLDLPWALDDSLEPFLAVYLRHNTSAALSARLTSDLNYTWNRIATLSPSTSIGEVIEINQDALINSFMIDNASTFIIKGYKLERNLSNEWQFAMIGEELVRFKNFEKIQDGLYLLSNITRGENGTEDKIHQHAINEHFVIIETGANIIPVSEKLIGKKVAFQSSQIEQVITYENKAFSRLNHFITTHTLNDEHLYLKWTTILKNNSNWSNEALQDDIEFTIKINNQGQVYTCKTDINEITIDIKDLDLSPNYSVAIL